MPPRLTPKACLEALPHGSDCHVIDDHQNNVSTLGIRTQHVHLCWPRMDAPIMDDIGRKDAKNT
eukprot:278377-Prorocentrum_lima.AAC.1